MSVGEAVRACPVTEPPWLVHGGPTGTALLGGDSPATEKAAAEALEAALRDGRIVVMPDQGHLAHGTAPELFAREVVQFLVHG